MLLSVWRNYYSEKQNRVIKSYALWLQKKKKRKIIWQLVNVYMITFMYFLSVKVFIATCKTKKRA